MKTKEQLDKLFLLPTVAEVFKGLETDSPAFLATEVSESKTPDMGEVAAMAVKTQLDLVRKIGYSGPIGEIVRQATIDLYSELWSRVEALPDPDAFAGNGKDLAKLADAILKSQERAFRRIHGQIEARPRRSDETASVVGWEKLLPEGQIALAESLCTGGLKQVELVEVTQNRSKKPFKVTTPTGAEVILPGKPDGQLIGRQTHLKWADSDKPEIFVVCDADGRPVQTVPYRHLTLEEAQAVLSAHTLLNLEGRGGSYKLVDLDEADIPEWMDAPCPDYPTGLNVTITGKTVENNRIGRRRPARSNLGYSFPPPTKRIVWKKTPKKSRGDIDADVSSSEGSDEAVQSAENAMFETLWRDCLSQAFEQVRWLAAYVRDPDQKPIWAEVGETPDAVMLDETVKDGEAEQNAKPAKPALPGREGGYGQPTLNVTAAYRFLFKAEPTKAERNMFDTVIRSEVTKARAEAVKLFDAALKGTNLDNTAREYAAAHPELIYPIRSEEPKSTLWSVHAKPSKPRTMPRGWKFGDNPDEAVILDEYRKASQAEARAFKAYIGCEDSQKLPKLRETLKSTRKRRDRAYAALPDSLPAD